MKKALFSIFIVIVVLMYSNVYADMINSVDTNGYFDANIKVFWYDYKNISNERPSSVKVNLIGNNSLNYTSATIDKNMCTIDSSNNLYDEWNCIVRFNGIRTNSTDFDKEYSLSSIDSSNFPSNYIARNELSHYDYVERANEIYNTGNIYIIANAKRKYYFNVVFDDDNNRDGVRPWDISYNLNNQDSSFYKTINIMPTSSESIISETDGFTYEKKNWQIIPQLYPYLIKIDGQPDFNSPATYSITPTTIYSDYEYNISENDNEYTMTYTHVPKKLIHDIPVNVNFEENIFKKPDSINVTLYTNNDFNVKSVTLNDNNWSYVFDNLYLNDVNLNPDYNHTPTVADYKIKVDSLENYNFEITGNMENGYNILVKYTGDKEYKIIEGANKIIDKNSNATFRIDADYSSFENGGKVYVDGLLISENYYTSLEGSTIITLNSEFIKSLTPGVHTLEVVFNNGITSTTTFVIKNYDKNVIEKTSIKNDNSKNPNTGDNIILYIIMLLFSSTGLIVIKKNLF